MCSGGGGGGSSTPPVTVSAPGSTAVATIDSATARQREELKNRLAKAKGRKYTNTTGGTGVSGSNDSVSKKQLIGQ